MVKEKWAGSEMLLINVEFECPLTQGGQKNLYSEEFYQKFADDVTDQNKICSF